MPFDQVNFVIPAVETDEVLRVLFAAKNRLRDPSLWCQEPMRGGALCAGNTAVAVAGELGLNVSGDFGRSLWGHLAAVVPNAPARPEDYAWVTVAEYNDSPNTTHADVLALFDRAIAARRKEVECV
jgi:hypothetical protein